VDSGKVAQFQSQVWDFYSSHRRSLPWRDDPSGYEVFVSEIMLQQTQVNRVIPKYHSWLKQFESFDQLRCASVADLVQAWQGLGYNRRVLWMRQSAEIITSEYGGRLPRDPDLLRRLPGIGPNTAGSLVAFAYNIPVVFIETNIRRVYIHEFFSGSDRVPDSSILELVSKTLDDQRPREWYYALMDLGADLAQRVTNPNSRSRHYGLQSKFEGSIRQLRGEVLRKMLDGRSDEKSMEIADPRLGGVLDDLVHEGFLEIQSGQYRLVK
jgi:A/G-specific adenine glycosylase